MGCGQLAGRLRVREDGVAFRPRGDLVNPPSRLRYPIFAEVGMRRRCRGLLQGRRLLGAGNDGGPCQAAKATQSGARASAYSTDHAASSFDTRPPSLRLPKTAAFETRGRKSLVS